MSSSSVPGAGTGAPGRVTAPAARRLATRGRAPTPPRPSATGAAAPAPRRPASGSARGQLGLRASGWCGGIEASKELGRAPQRTKHSPTLASRSGSAIGASRSARRAELSASKRAAACRHSSFRCWSTPWATPCLRPSATPCLRASLSHCLGHSATRSNNVMLSSRVRRYRLRSGASFPSCSRAPLLRAFRRRRKRPRRSIHHSAGSAAGPTAPAAPGAATRRRLASGATRRLC